MLPLLLLLCMISPNVIATQNSTTVICVPGQCLQGTSNTTLGAVLSAPGAQASVQILPGRYDSSTNPQLLHSILTGPSLSISPSPGFQNVSSSINLPLNLALEPGFDVLSGPLYSGHSQFIPLPTAPASASTNLTGEALVLSSNVWAAFAVAAQNHVVLWESVPDMNELPFAVPATLSLLDLQSSACSPTCAGAGICGASGTCACKHGFSGSSCETCASGFFGPTCQPCPGNCTTCDDGISGSGRCLKPLVSNALSACNCLNGVCSADGQCTCIAGFTRGDNGVACAKCLPGFFLTSTGDCKVCQNGCTACADTTGVCATCKPGFSQDSGDRTKCSANVQATSGGALCPPKTFGDGANCTPCDSACSECHGPTAADCTTCAAGTYMLNGSCVSADATGICAGTGLVADNVKGECDACGAKCTACNIPNFTTGSLISQLKCTACLPGSVLFSGTCTDSCPSGSFLSSQDNLNCLPCDATCSSCVNSAKFCLSCPYNLLASNGTCVSTCPSGTFSSSGSCVLCHPDCGTCIGGSFTQCTSCFPNRPVLQNSRCLPVCSKSQFYDPSSSSCVTCDSSCSSCSGRGPSNCLACAGSGRVLHAGSCVDANCRDNAQVIPGLGVCLSDLVQASETGSPMPTISGLTTPTTTRRGLKWWQILLLALGCALVILLVLWFCRRRRSKKNYTGLLPPAPIPGQKWWARVEHFLGSFRFAMGRKCAHKKTSNLKEIRLVGLQSSAGESHGVPHYYRHDYAHRRPKAPVAPAFMRNQSVRSASSAQSSESMYSQQSHLTRETRTMPVPRQPVKQALPLLPSRF